MTFELPLVIQLILFAAWLGGLATVVWFQKGIADAQIKRLEHLEERLGKVENRMTRQETICMETQKRYVGRGD